MKHILIFIILLIIILFVLNLVKNKQEFFENNSFILKKSPHGFYSMLLATTTNYYNFENKNKNFRIKLDDWIYKNKNGWIDYFQPVDLKLNNDTNYKEIKWQKQFNDIKIIDLIKTIPKIYKYNSEVKMHINNIKNKLNLLDQKYDAIYVRRGDKIAENNLVRDINYIKVLIMKNPFVSIVFIQTDDYNVYLNIKKYLKDNDYNITLLTICNENMKGSITDNYFKKEMLKKIEPNTISKYKDIKPLSDMSLKEKKEHMYELLTGVDILINSSMCVVDYETNVGRFIKYAHKNPRNVFDVNNPNRDINYNKVINCFERDLY
jgi:hypothetical protein